jgi:hypothetical protein
MKTLKIQILIAMMLIAGGWLQAQTVTVGPWTFYPSPLGGTMQGQAQINGVVAAAEDVIAAFEPGGECVGAKLMTMSGGVAYINFIIYGDDQLGGNHGMNFGENFTLKIRDSSAHCTYVYYPSLSGWQNTSFMPMPGYNNFNAVFNFVPCTLSTSTTSLSLPATPAGTTTFNITTYCDWTISESLTWLSVSPASGTGDATITVTYDANTGAQRTGNIGVNVNCTTPVTIGVTQGGNSTLIVSPATRTVPANAGSTSFAVTSNTTWTVTDDATWLTVTPSGSNNGTITASFTANTGPQRVATIIVTGEGVATPVTVTVTQASGCTLAVTPASQNVTCAAGTSTFSITTACAWTITESTSWLTVSPMSGSGNGTTPVTVTVTYDANSTGASRTSGNITVTVADVTPVNVSVTQDPCCTIAVTPANQNVTAPAGTTTFSVASACAWTITESESWLSVSPTSGTGNVTITVTYNANTGAQRIGTITVTVAGVTPVLVTVTQPGSLYLTVTPANRDVTSSSGNTTFAISSNTTWTVSDNATWLAATPTSGSNNGTITATYSANTGAQRVATITVTGAGVTPATMVTVTQSCLERTITVASQNPASGVAITVSPTDNAGLGNGTTQFTRTYCNATSVTLTAPLNASGSTFARWLKNGTSYSTTAGITFSANANDTYTSVYENTLTVSLPDSTVPYASTVEIPMIVTNTTGLGILACQFTVTFDNTIVVPASPYIITTGTLSGTAGWTFAANPNNPGQLVVACAGSNVLSGSGVLLKLKFNVVGDRGDQTNLTFTDFDFNAGNPIPTLVNGSILVQPKVCGDVDCNGIVQAYDASLILQYLVGLIQLQDCGLINADVDEDGQITVLDASLILIHVVGGTQPVPTCFDADQGFYAGIPEKYIFKAKLINLVSNSYLTTGDIVLDGIRETGQVYGVSFDIYSPNAEMQSLTMPNLPNGYMMVLNPTDGHTYRVALINTNGVLSADMKMHIEMTGFGAGANLTMNNIVLNNHEMPGIKLTCNSASDNSVSESLIAYPNPFNSTTNITWEVNEDSQVILEIMDMFGRKVKTLANQHYERGFYNLTWNGDNQKGNRMQPGWYIVKLTAAGTCQQIKVNLMY